MKTFGMLAMCLLAWFAIEAPPADGQGRLEELEKRMEASAPRPASAAAADRPVSWEFWPTNASSARGATS